MRKVVNLHPRNKFTLQEYLQLVHYDIENGKITDKATGRDITTMIATRKHGRYMIANHACTSISPGALFTAITLGRWPEENEYRVIVIDENRMNIKGSNFKLMKFRAKTKDGKRTRAKKSDGYEGAMATLVSIAPATTAVLHKALGGRETLTISQVDWWIRTARAEDLIHHHGFTNCRDLKPIWGAGPAPAGKSPDEMAAMRHSLLVARKQSKAASEPVEIDEDEADAERARLRSRKSLDAALSGKIPNSIFAFAKNFSQSACTI